jgi:hypothetical protein
VTLWRLTDPLEERLETLWEGWHDDAKSCCVYGYCNG